MFVDQKKITELTGAELSALANQIGQTPMQPVRFWTNGEAHTIHLKLEGTNPTGSMKDRTGYALIRHLAFKCKARGYRFIAVVDPKTTQENIAKMKMFNATIEMVSQPDANGGYLLSRLARVQELCQTHKNYLWTDQYASPANPQIHYQSTGPEIYHQMNERVDAVFIPVSTGGTLAGIGRFFREVSPSTHVVGVDAYGSVIFGSRPAPRRLTGIGSSRQSNFITRDLYNAHVLVRDEEAFMFCRTLCANTGISVGGSSGAVLAACAHYMLSHPALTRVVCVCADSGGNYASSIFHETWLRQQGMHLSPDHLGSVEDITF